MRIRERARRSVALGAVAALCVAAGGAMAAAQPGDPVAMIVTLAGRAEIARRSAGSWTAAALRDDLFAGDSARTLAGRLTLRLSSGRALRLGPRTQIIFAVPEGSPATAPTRVHMDGGRLWVAVREAAAEPSAVELQAGPVTVNVPGGGISIAMNPDGSVSVAVVHGTALCAGEGWTRALSQDQVLIVPAMGRPAAPAALKRSKTDGEWMAWNENQDLAGGYGSRRAQP